MMLDCLSGFRNSIFTAICFKEKNSPFCLPFGKAGAAHLLRCRGLAVENYGFPLGRLESEQPRLSLK